MTCRRHVRWQRTRFLESGVAHPGCLQGPGPGSAAAQPASCRNPAAPAGTGLYLPAEGWSPSVVRPRAVPGAGQGGRGGRHRRGLVGAALLPGAHVGPWAVSRCGAARLPPVAELPGLGCCCGTLQAWRWTAPRALHRPAALVACPESVCTRPPSRRRRRPAPLVAPLRRPPRLDGDAGVLGH